MTEQRVQRRLAAILVADVVGYSRLMGADEESTLLTLKSYREIVDRLVTRHDGRVFGRGGDSILAEFGSAVEAVRAAITIQEELRVRNAELPEEQRMLFRIGINVGDIMVEGDDLFGDGVNVAARLEALAEPGGICISGSAFGQVKNKLSVAFQDIGAQEVKNIAEPVPAFRIVPGPISVAAPARAGKRWRVPAVAAMVAVLVVAAAAAVWTFAFREQTPTPSAATRTSPQHLSIVVLPFDNLSGDAKQDYFADGITEDLITDLSRIRGAFVIARGTSFTYKGKKANARDVAKKLNVRYVLEGSVRRSGDQVRVNAQLIDGETEAHIWSERFDRRVRDVFSLQNEITGRLAALLKFELLENESRQKQRGGPSNLTAWDYALQGFVKEYQSSRTDHKSHSEAKSLLEKAIELNPQEPLAWTGLARFYYTAGAIGVRGISRMDARKKMVETAEKAVALDPRSADAYTTLGMAYRLARQPAPGLAACQKALAINPNNDEANTCAGMAQLGLGRSDLAINLLEKSLKLNPIRNTYRRHYFVGLAYLTAGKHTEAIAVLRKAIAGNPKFSSSYYALASALAWSDQIEEARATAAKFIQMDRNRGTIERMRRRIGYISPNFDHVLEGLRKAGMPETDADLPPTMSIVVLPFDNLSGDAKQDYFADGITEDLISDLSRIRGAFVIARGTSFTYKGKKPNPKEVAKELNVRYVLEGSVRRAGDQVRVNAQLIDGSTGAHIWSERFDRTMKDVFSLQDDVTGRLASALNLELLQAESHRLGSGQPADLQAWDYALRAWAELITKPRSKDSVNKAAELVKNALALDRNLARAWTAMARVHYMGAVLGWGTRSRTESRRLALEAAQRAVALDPNDAEAHSELGNAYRINDTPGHWDKSIASCEQALAINPNADVYFCLAAAYNMGKGRPAESLRLIEKWYKNSPRVPTAGLRFWQLAMAHLELGQFDKALAAAEKGIAANPRNPSPRQAKVSALGWLGRKDEAIAALSDLRDRNRNSVFTSVERLKKHYEYWPYKERFIEGLRRAGMPEK